MKKTLFALLALTLFAGSFAVAGTLPGPAGDVAVQLSETGEYTPFWFDTTTAAICPGFNACTSNFDCQLYFNPDWICINPSGARCAGECVPC
ncbi:MAG: hypothetical protein AAGC60_20465 [Acidobacteriota bacterium]